MRNTVKLLPALLLGSVLGGCSMAGTGDYFADEYTQAQTWGQTGQYAQASCWSPEAMAQPQAPQQQAYQPSCGHVNHGQANYGQQAYVQPNVAQPTYAQPQYGQAPIAQPTYVQPNYGQPVYAQNTYGQAAFVPPTYGANPGLRGPKPASDSYVYGTLGGVNYELGEDLYGIQGRVGYQINRFFGVEAEGSLGLVDDNDEFIDAAGNVFDQEVGIDNSVAGFGVIRYPLFGNFSGVSRVGYHTSNLNVGLTDTAGGSAEADFNTDGFAYGTGVEFAVDPKTALRVDYTIYDFDGPDAEALSLAVSRKF